MRFVVALAILNLGCHSGTDSVAPNPACRTLSTGPDGNARVDPEGVVYVHVVDSITPRNFYSDEYCYSDDQTGNGIFVANRRDRFRSLLIAVGPNGRRLSGGILVLRIDTRSTPPSITEVGVRYFLDMPGSDRWLSRLSGTISTTGSGRDSGLGRIAFDLSGYPSRRGAAGANAKPFRVTGAFSLDEGFSGDIADAIEEDFADAIGHS